MKILNLYAGIGGNRKLWDKEHLGFDVDITAVELNPQIAKIYQDFFPNDKVIVADAHQYLLEHFKEFDFIWSSPPCPTHSRFNNISNLRGGCKYPDMALYQEIIYLKHWFKGKWCVENVISYYEPLIKPYELASHYFWANFHISARENITRNIRGEECHHRIKEFSEEYGMDLSKYTDVPDRRKIIKNCVEPETGLHILRESIRNIHPELFEERGDFFPEPKRK